MVGDDDGVGRADKEAMHLPRPARGVVAREVTHHDVRQRAAHALHARRARRGGALEERLGYLGGGRLRRDLEEGGREAGLAAEEDRARRRRTPLVHARLQPRARHDAHMVEALPRRAPAAAREELVLLVGRCVREQVRAVGGEAAEMAAELRDEAAQVLAHLHVEAATRHNDLQPVQRWQQVGLLGSSTSPCRVQEPPGRRTGRCADRG